MKKHIIIATLILALATPSWAKRIDEYDAVDAFADADKILISDTSASGREKTVTGSALKTYTNTNAYSGTLLTGVTSSITAIQTIANELDSATDFTLATVSDVNTGTSTTTIINPDVLAGSNIGTKEVAWLVKNSATVTAVADGTEAFVVPASMSGMNLVDVTCSVADLNSAASGTTTVVLRRVRGATAVDMTSTGVTINYDAYSDSDETIDTSNDDIATGDKIYVDVNAVTSAVQKGLGCTASFRLP